MQNQLALYNVNDYALSNEELKQQLCLTDDVLKFYVKKKRIRYKVPKFVKKYECQTIHTDDLLCNLDINHIFRVKTLHRIYSLLYGFCDVDLFVQDEKLVIDGLTVWIEDRQAEIPNTERLSIKQRLHLHIKLLKILRKGIPLKSALCQVMGGVQ